MYKIEGMDVMQMTLKKLIMVLMVSTLACRVSQAAASNTTRFFYSGDGRIHLVSNKNTKTFKGRYRTKTGAYDESAYHAILSVFGAAGNPGNKAVSLRLIEFMDYLEDKLRPGTLITITSGYRPPEYNANLRKKGALAAKASLHQYGMAADFIMTGVSSKRIWEYIRSLRFGGTGYYHGQTVHVDVGPARFWDEKSSGVGTGISDDNKLIGLITDFDILAPGDTVNLRFIRMTAFPIQLHPEFELISMQRLSKDDRPPMMFKPDSAFIRNERCAEFSNIDQMASFRWTLPSDLPPGRYIIRARFCDNKWEKMPDMVFTPEFEVRLP